MKCCETTFKRHVDPRSYSGSQNNTDQVNTLIFFFAWKPNHNFPFFKVRIPDVAISVQKNMVLPFGARKRLRFCKVLLPSLFDPSELRSEFNGKVLRRLENERIFWAGETMGQMVLFDDDSPSSITQYCILVWGEGCMFATCFVFKIWVLYSNQDCCFWWLHCYSDTHFFLHTDFHTKSLLWVLLFSCRRIQPGSWQWTWGMDSSTMTINGMGLDPSVDPL